LLRRIVPDFRVVSVDVDETRLPRERPADCVLRLATLKVRAVAEQVEDAILGADTLVVVGDRILGKPPDLEAVRAMLGCVSGRQVMVVTGVVLWYSGRVRQVLTQTGIRFKQLASREVEAYCATGEGLGKAGGLSLQGSAAGFVVAMEGSLTGAVGLPVDETARLLAGAGL